MLAAHAWKTIDAAHSCGMSWGEESNTEFLLLNLKLHHPTEVRVTAFSKHEESVNGADWEWWFVSPGAYYGMRVQAKRIKESNGTFGYLRYKAKSSPKDQMTNLIDEARSDRLTPVYCFYAASDQPSWNPAWPHSKPPQTGCLIGHAEQVRDAHSNHLSDLRDLLMPWHFLVCPCASDAYSDVAHRAAAAMSRTVKAVLVDDPLDEEGKENRQPWLAAVRTQPPTYVSKLIDLDRTGELSSEEVLSHSELSKRDIKGILVISDHAFERG